MIHKTAFPIQSYTCAEKGMTMRDYFAAEAMQGMMVEVQDPDCNYIAEVSYRMADAMMKAREA